MDEETLDPIVGTDAGEILTGTAGDDNISGLGGDDVIFGGGDGDGDGNDTISGGDGNDSLAGQAGDDTLQGDAGDDLLLGLSDNDLLMGGEGSDRLAGDAGNDTLLGGSESDTAIFGGTFADYAIAATDSIPDGGGGTVSGLEVADTRAQFPPNLNDGTDLVAGDIESIEFADAGSVLDLAGFDPAAPPLEPTLLAVAAADFTVAPGEDGAPFVEAIGIAIPPDGSNPGSVTITDTELSVAGTPETVAFEILGAPTIGTLLLGEQSLVVGDAFTQADINAGALSYQIDAPIPAGVTADSFEFSVVSGPFTLTEFPVVRDATGNITAQAAIDAVTGEPLPLAVSFDLAPAFALDVDQNDSAEAATDGLNILRVLLGAPAAAIELGTGTPDGIDQGEVVETIESFL